jgi:hypothetical protein
MGRKITPTRAVVQHAGFGYRLKATNLRREFELGSPLRYLLQQYTQNLLAGIAKVTTPAIRPPLRSGIPFGGSPAPLA